MSDLRGPLRRFFSNTRGSITVRANHSAAIAHLVACARVDGAGGARHDRKQLEVREYPVGDASLFFDAAIASTS